ncbi:MAG: hypothetical protein DMG45_11775 [Acidobacteria bacterium]|nr:MAG: hypothetical protein DMG45_11775 [Acidobacteriota bacterium]
MLARVVDGDGIHQRRNQVHAGIQRTGASAPEFAHTDARRSVGNNREALRDQQEQGARRGQLQRQPPAHRAERAASQRSHLRAGFVRFVPRQEPPQLFGEINVVGDQSSRASKESRADNHQQPFQGHHGPTPSFLFPGAPPRSGDRRRRRLR